ncbi:MAG: thiopurine S-methyltransferase [Myxococcota bacterium]|nr:thiopurine S-methyltransferase [Myxococcota bacterium]
MTINNEFWLKKWNDGIIGFHRKSVNEKLSHFFDQIKDESTKRVYVPLCGKSLDMIWLAQQGMEVIGSEISELAIQQFFRENEISFEQTRRRFSSQQVVIENEDFFNFDPRELGTVDAIYDRAAMVAMPSERHAEYAERLLEILRPGGSILLVTFTYKQEQMSGPPFSVTEQSVLQYFKTAKITQLFHQSILEKEPKFQSRGLDSLTETVWRVQKP